MQRRKLLRLGSILLVATTGCVAMADKPADLASAPASVQATIKKAAGNNAIKDLAQENEDGKSVYEAKFEDGGVEQTVSVSPTGELLEQESEIKVADLPPVISSAFLKSQPLGVAKSASKVTADGKSFYEIDAKVGKEKHELQIATDGTLIADKIDAKEKGSEHEDKDEDHEQRHEKENDKD